MGNALHSNRMVEVAARNFVLPKTLQENGVGPSGGSYVKKSGNGIQYIVPAGVTLLLPYADGAADVDSKTETIADVNGSSMLEHANKKFYTTTHPHKNDYLKPNLYVHVTMEIPTGAEMQVVGGGKLVIGGELLSDTGIACAPCGAHSNLVVNGRLTLQSGSIGSVCGYILGSGQVKAESGATIYQPFTIMDFRGGGYTTSTIEKTGLRSGETAITPFTRYTMAGIQAELVLHSGAKLYGYCSLHTGDALRGMVKAQHNVTTTLIVGGTNETALLKLRDGATLTSTYDPQTTVRPYSAVGRSKLTINGGADMGVLSLHIKVTVAEKTVTTDGLTFPLPYNYELHLNGAGSIYEVGYALSLMPGATLRVGEGATLRIRNHTGSAAFRFAVYDGLNDHTTTAASIAYNNGSQTHLANPNAKNLQNAGLNGTANLIVAGTLNIGPNVHFGGVVQSGGDFDQATGEGPALLMDPAAIPEAQVQMGLIGDVTAIKTYTYGGATVRTLKAQLLDTATGQRLDIQAGETYHGSGRDSTLDTYTYTLYPDGKAPGTSETHTEALGAQVEGSWWNYEVPVYDVLPGASSVQTVLRSEKLRFAHGANLTAGLETAPGQVEKFFTDEQLTVPATVITGNAPLYVQGAPAAEIVNGDNNGRKFITLQEAVDAYDAGTPAGNGDDAGLPYIRMLRDTAEASVTVSKDVYLDLNGRTVSGDVTVSGGTLYGMDTASDDYDGTDAGRILGTVSGPVAEVHQTGRKCVTGFRYGRYVKTTAAGETAFHRFNISVVGYDAQVNTVTKELDVFFYGRFQGDEAAKKALTAVGFQFNRQPSPRLAVRGADVGDYSFSYHWVRAAVNADTARLSNTILATAWFHDRSQDSDPREFTILELLTDMQKHVTVEQQKLIQNLLDEWKSPRPAQPAGPGADPVPGV